MKKTFDQTKKETAKISANAFGIRSIAILMFFVMLFTAIGSGSVLSALAVTRGDEGADDSIAESVKVSEDFASSADLYDTEEALLGRKSDSDLSGTGAKADLAATGTTYYLHYGTDASKNPEKTTCVTMTDAGNNTYTASFTAGSNNYFFGINDSTTAGSSFTRSTSFTSTTTNWGNIEDGYNYYWATSWASEGSTVYVTYNSSTGAVTSSASSSGSSSSSNWYVYGKYFGKWKDWSTSDIINMSYDAVTGYYYTTHTVGATEDRFRIYNPNDNHYKPSNDTELVLNGAKVTGTAGWSENYFGLDNISSGTEVILWWDATNHQVWVTTPETTHDVTFSAGEGGTISPSGTVAVGESTATSVTATASAGYKFSSWTNGTGITQKTDTASGDNQTQTITTKSSGDYTVTANFTKKNLTVTKGAPTGGDYTLSTTSAQIGDTVTISNIIPANGYVIGTVSTTPSTTVTQSDDDYTFTMPGSDVTVNVTFTAVSYNVSTVKSPNNGGTLYVSTSDSNPSSSTSTTYTIGNTLYYKATAAAAYTLSSVDIAYSDDTETQHITSVTSGTATSVSMANHTGDVTITANFTKKPTHKVTVVSNNNSYGTATTSVVDAYQGQSVTLTATENSGTWSKWTVTSGTMATVNNKTTNPLTFTMGSEDLTITANFDEYVGKSTWYYNGYPDTGAVNDISYYGVQMDEAKLNGVKYAYYHVTGRTDDSVNEQLFTVSTKTPKHTGNVYFTRPGSSSTGWWNNKTPQVYFMDSAYKELDGGWKDMEADGDGSNGDYNFRHSVPWGAHYAIFRDNGGSGLETVTIDLTATNCCYSLDNTKVGDKCGLKQWDSANSYAANLSGFYEYLYNGNIYTNDYKTKGFYSHNTNNRDFAKPQTSSGDYYILLFYKNSTYTYNDVTKKVTEDCDVIWATELPDSGDTIKVYAKDGAIAGYGQTYADLADTTVLKADGTTSAGATQYTSYGNQTYEVYKAQPGETITIKTTIGLDKDGNALTSPTAADLRAKYYVRGFMVNGEVPKNTQITKPDTTNGVYTLTYTVPEDYTGKYIEITPVYFLVNTSDNPVVTFRMTNFPKGQHNWGDTPYVYPFYGRLGSYNNAFGVYAGQPMFFYNGQYTMQIPQKSTAWAYDSDSKNNKGAANLTEVNNTTVSGVTMSNGYYDKVHMLIMGYGDNSASADHVQTYDYGDFYKIFNEKKPVDNIVFDFKYETAKHNFENQPGTSITKTNLESNYGTNGNGFEDLKNFHGRNVDLFGTPLSGDQLNADPVYVVSIGGVNGSAGVENIAGYYATEWMVYGSSDGDNYTLITDGESGGKSSIPPEVLVLNNNSTSFNDTTYPSADANHTLTNWKALYTALEAYRGKPVKISYEAADAQKGAGDYATSGSGGATRNDGRWLYSKTGESITSKIKIQYSDDNGDTYTDLNATNPQVEGLSAYFTNTEVYGKQTYATTIDPDKTFDFEAKTTNASYKFVGWYMDDDNKTQITTDNDGSTERFGSYTFIARFKLVTEGQLILSHSVDTDTIGGIKYDGAGTVTIGAVVKDGDGNTKKTYAPSTSDITIDNGTYISSESACTIDVTLTATRGNNSALGTTLLATPSGQDAKFFDYGNFTLSDDGKTRTYTFTVKVSDLFTGTKQDYMNLIYHSYFRNYVFNYTVNYEFNDRFGNAKIYNRAGTLTAPEAEAYVYKDKMTGTSGNTTEMRMLRKEFFENLAPYESNFQQDVKWTFTDSQFTGGTNYVYNCNAHFSASYENENKKVDVTFVLPYEHLNGVATLNNGVGTAATATNYAMIKESEETDNRVTFGEIPVLTDNRTNGIYNEAEKEHWIAAPLKLSDGTFFSHWSVKTTDTNTEVARCYFPGFNFLAYDNYEITAVYGSAAVDMSKTGVSTAVTYLDTTRNQWNALSSLDDAAAPNVPASDKVTAGDILYNDFVLSYNYNGVEIHQGGSDTNDINELGIVVERIKELDKNSDDTYDTRISSYTGLDDDTEKITTAAKTTGDANGQATIKDSGKQYYKQSINKTALDNKDRIVFFEAFSNTAGWNSEKQRPVGNYSYKKYVYRAYTYITYNDGGETKTVLSETPAYFIMYDIATADYSAN